MNAALSKAAVPRRRCLMVSTQPWMKRKVVITLGDRQQSTIETKRCLVDHAHSAQCEEVALADLPNQRSEDDTSQFQLTHLIQCREARGTEHIHSHAEDLAMRPDRWLAP